MTERRPHWDAELLDAVGRSMHAFYDRPDAMHVYAAIAAVEDWYGDRWDGYAESPPEIMQRLDQTEAAVARVRELCDESDRNRPRIDGYLINRTVPVKDILRALDGTP